MAPNAARDMNIPTRRPASSILPIAAAGAVQRDTYPPVENLNRMSWNLAASYQQMPRVPIDTGYYNELYFICSKWPGECHDSRYSSESCHGVKCTCSNFICFPLVHSVKRRTNFVSH